MEISNEVKTISFHYICDDCGNGEMIKKGIGVKCMGKNCGFPHRCNNCNSEKVLKRSYPYIGYEKVPNVS